MSIKLDARAHSFDEHAKERSELVACGRAARRRRGRRGRGTTSSRGTRDETTRRGASGAHAEHELVGGELHGADGRSTSSASDDCRIVGNEAGRGGNEGGRDLARDQQATSMRLAHSQGHNQKRQRDCQQHNDHSACDQEACRTRRPCQQPHRSCPSWCTETRDNGGKAARWLRGACEAFEERGEGQLV